MRKGSKGRVQAKGNVVNEDTHLVPTPLATQGSSSRSARPQGGCILSGVGGILFLVCAPQDLGHTEATVSSLLCLIRTSVLHTAGRLRGCGREETAGVESWGTFGAAKGWGRPGEKLRWVKRPGAPARAGRGGQHSWLGPASRTTRAMPHPQLPPSSSFSSLRLLRGTSNCPVFQAWDNMHSADLQGLRFEKSKQDRKYKFISTLQSHFNGGFMVG